LGKKFIIGFTYFRIFELLVQADEWAEVEILLGAIVGSKNPEEFTWRFYGGLGKPAISKEETAVY